MRSKDGSTAVHYAATKGHGSAIFSILCSPPATIAPSGEPTTLLRIDVIQHLLIKMADRKARNSVALSAK